MVWACESSDVSPASVDSSSRSAGQGVHLSLDHISVAVFRGLAPPPPGFNVCCNAPKTTESLAKPHPFDHPHTFTGHCTGCGDRPAAPECNARDPRSHVASAQARGPLLILQPEDRRDPPALLLGYSPHGVRDKAAPVTSVGARSFWPDRAPWGVPNAHPHDPLYFYTL